MLHLILLVGMNNPRNSCWEAQRISIQEGSQLFSIFFSWKFCEQNCAWFVNKMDISYFHKRKMKKIWLPSWILIPCAFQHDFLVLFIPMNKMRCSILSHAEDVLVKINFEVETRGKKWRLYIIPLHFIKSRFQHCLMLNIEFWRIFLEISCIMVSGGSYRRICWWKSAIQCSKWIWASFCILFHTNF